MDVCKLGVLLGRRGREGAYIVDEPRAGGGGVVHVDVVFGGGVRHAAGDGGGTPWVWRRLEWGAGAPGQGRAGLLTAESFFHANADVGQGVPVCPFGELGAAYDTVESLVCGRLDVGVRTMVLGAPIICHAEPR